ncbi:2OG-Fe(II) oxygenase [Caulobacter sp. S45]|uniref:2OG-Fe(II) oxygenase n=1 Tax=Caulobacter sp. S45 TaxID=1641861 RepID=UPI001C203980|nr:2OG-Fe(II) oxygenase [Caulobacter sp. S45]
MTEKSPLTRGEMADHIVARLQQAGASMRSAFNEHGRVPSSFVDDLLPVDMAQAIHAAFPDHGRMMFKNSIKERKFVAAQMDAYPAILEEIVYAFQDPRVLYEVAAITGLQALQPDADLYAGGLSAMPKGAYLKPHLDNSHDGARARYRVLNLLYYVTPDWREDFGGNLQLWDQGPKGAPRTIPALFNRLVLMATNRTSWHSVQEVKRDQTRCCVSNYYFSSQSPEMAEYFHATSFRGEPDQPLSDAIMRADNALRTTVLKTFGAKVYNNPHVYRRTGEDKGDEPNRA